MLSHKPTAYLSVYNLFLTHWIINIIKGYYKPDSFESYNLQIFACSLQNLKPLTSQPNHPQISQIRDKPPTNQWEIASFFPWRHFPWLDRNSGPKNCNICHHAKYNPFTHPTWGEKWVRFFIFLPDFTFCLIHYTVLYDP